MSYYTYLFISLFMALFIFKILMFTLFTPKR